MCSVAGGIQPDVAGFSLPLDLEPILLHRLNVILPDIIQPFNNINVCLKT